MRKTRVSLILALTLGMLGLSPGGPAQSGPPTWTTHGPYGGSMGSIVTAPSDSSIMFAGSGHLSFAGTAFGNGFTDGVFRSSDSGDTWTRVGATFATPVISLAVDRTNPDIVYAGTSTYNFGTPLQGVQKSTNGGQTWTPISADAGEPKSPVYSLQVDPVAANTIYAGTDYGVFKSDNGGTDWDPVNTGFSVAPDPPTTKVPVRSFAVGNGALPADPPIIYVAAGNSVYKSEDPEADGWASTSLGTAPPTALVTDPNAPGTVYAGTNGAGVWKTTNFGAGWTQLNSVDPPSGGFGFVFSLAIDPRTPDPNGSDPPVLYAGTDFRGYKSTNDGTSWQSFGASGVPLGHVAGMLVHPANANKVWMAGGNGLLKSVDAGASWLDDQPGIDNTTIVSLLADPEDDSVLYAGAQGGGGAGFFRYAGTQWESRNKLNTQSAASVMSGLYSMVADPSTDPPTIISTFFGGVAKTIDGGQQWTGISDGLPPSPPWNTATAALAIDPQDPDILYAGGYNTLGVYKTTNYDQNDWVKKSDGLMAVGDSKFFWDLLATDNAVYAAASRIAGTDGGVYKLTNGGNDWDPVNTGLPTIGTGENVAHVAYDLVEDPGSPNTLYVATAGGVFKTTNGGTNWQPMGLNSGTGSLTIDPSDPGTIYAGSFAGVVSQGSTDGGSWVALPTLKPAFIYALLAREGTVYAGMSGGVYEITPSGGPPPVRKPDAQIKLGNKPAIGKGIYNTNAKNQTKIAKLEKGEKATFRQVITNRGNDTDSFKVKGPSASGPFTAKYTFDGDDVTSQVKAGTLVLPNVAKNKSETITIVIGVKNSADPGDKLNLLVKASSANAPTKVDAVKAGVKVVKP